MQFKKYTKEQLIHAVSTSKSISQVLKKLNIASHGGNYRTITKYIKTLKLDISHFTGQASNKGRNFGPKRPIQDYLSNKYPIASHSLRKKLLNEKIFDYKCYQCNLTTWQGVKIPLELEHIDGNHSNNNLENLTLLCPNCHALTPTYRGRNISYTTSKPNKIVDGRAKLKPKLRKVERPDYETLKRELEESNYSAVGRKYGVSDNAIRKWIKTYEKYSS